MENLPSGADSAAIIARIRYLIGEAGINQYEFAEKIGVDASNLSKHLNGKLPVNDSLLNKIVVNLGVSKKWLRDGTDVPYSKDAVPQVLEGGQLAAVQKGTPVYSVDVTAGPMTRSMMFSQENIVGYIDIPAIPDDCRIVRVSGDSMTPVINNGDYLAVRELRNPDLIFWGQIYVLLLDDYRMVKYLRKHDNPDMVILRSENPKYDDMEVRRTDIRDIMIVHNILHIDTRM